MIILSWDVPVLITTMAWNMIGSYFFEKVLSTEFNCLCYFIGEPH